MKKIIFYALFLALMACGGGSMEQAQDEGVYPVKTDEFYQYVDKKGEPAFDAKFTQASFFHNGAAVVSLTTGLRGHIDKKGNQISPIEYKDLSLFGNDNLAWAVKPKGKLIAINKKGEEVFTLEGAEMAMTFSEGLAAFMNNDDQVGYVNTKGEVVIEPQFEAADFFNCGKAAIRARVGSENLWGFINKKGEMIIEPQFSMVDAFTNSGMALVKVGENYGVINGKGKYVVNPQPYELKIDGKDVVIANEKGKFAWQSITGKKLNESYFDQAYPFDGSDLAVVKIGDRYGYVNADGEYEINPRFSSASPFIGKHAIVQHGGKAGLIDTKGNFVLKPVYEGFGAATSYHRNFTESDFFDVDELIKRFEKLMANNSFDNLPINATAGQLLTKYNLKKNDFRSYNKIHKLYTKRMMKYVDLEISLIGSPFISQRSGYWTEQVFAPSAVCNQYVGELNLSGKASDKLYDIFGKLEAAQARITQANQSFKFECYYNEHDGIISIMCSPK